MTYDPVDANDDGIVESDVDNESVDTDKETINHGVVRGRHSEYIDAAKFDGDDPDARLDSALSAANAGDTIYLENDVYDTDRTISTQVSLVGFSADNATGTELAGNTTLTLDVRCRVVGIALSGTDANINVNSERVRLNAINGRGDNFITISNGEVMLTELHLCEVTFEAGTSLGLVDSCVRTNVTDNGSNTVGDIA